MTTWQIKQGNSRALSVQLTEEDDVTAVPLTGCTVTFLLRDPGTFAPLFTNPAVVDDVDKGLVHYQFLSADTAVAGDYLGEFEVHYPNGDNVSFPTGTYINVRITPALDAASFPEAGGTSVYDWLEETRRLVEGAQRAVQNLLAGGLDKAVVKVPLQADVGPLNPGDRLSLGLETMYVTAYERATRTATVIRGSGNTPITNHLIGELVRVNPRWTNYELFRALNSGLGRMSSAGLWTPRTVLRTVDVLTRTYDLAADMIGKRLLEVSYQQPGVTMRWEEVRDFDVLASVDKEQYPSGKALVIAEPLTQNQPLRIIYRGNLGYLQSVADEVGEATGLEQSAFDLPPIAAALYLTVGTPVQRADPSGQGTVRRAEEVSTSDVLNAPGALRQLYTQRINEEITRLNQQWENKDRLRRWL